MTKGTYTRFRVETLPSISTLGLWFGGEFYACHSDFFQGDGVLVELAAPGGPLESYPAAWRDVESFSVHSLEFFGDAMLEAGGVAVSAYAIVADAERQTPGWRAIMGFLTHVLDDVDVSHPRAAHAATEYRNFFMLEN